MGWESPPFAVMVVSYTSQNPCHPSMKFISISAGSSLLTEIPELTEY
jgi:hypothetical protein